MLYGTELLTCNVVRYRTYLVRSCFLFLREVYAGEEVMHELAENKVDTYNYIGRGNLMENRFGS